MNLSMPRAQDKFNFCSCKLALGEDSNSLLILFFSRYVNKDREITKGIVQHAEKRGIKGLFITVDAPQLGRREKASTSYDANLKSFW